MQYVQGKAMALPGGLSQEEEGDLKEVLEDLPEEDQQYEGSSKKCSP